MPETYLQSRLPEIKTEQQNKGSVSSEALLLLLFKREDCRFLTLFILHHLLLLSLSCPYISSKLESRISSPNADPVQYGMNVVSVWIES